MKNKIDAVLLCSGGMDSTTLMYWLIKKDITFIPLFIDYGQHCRETEYKRLLDVIPSDYKDNIKIINLASIYHGSSSALIQETDLWKTTISNDDLYLPYRNLLFLSTAAAFAQSGHIKKVFAGFINSNHAIEIDCSTTFFNNLSELLNSYGSVDIELPFKDYSKYDVAKLALQIGAPIALTFSCQVSSKVPCGACPNCVERLEALKMINGE